MRMCIKLMGVQLIGMANKTSYLGRLWALPNDSRHNEAGFRCFRWFRLIRCAYESLDLEIWRLLCWRQTFRPLNFDCSKIYLLQCFAGQLSRKAREWHLSLSLYKLRAFVTCSTTELSTWEPLPIYLFHWTSDLQSTVTTRYIPNDLVTLVPTACRCFIPCACAPAQH
jgi:hypothetical protein